VEAKTGMPMSALNTRLLTLCGAVLVIIAIAGCDSGNANSPNPTTVGAVPIGDASGFSATISDADSPHFVRRAELGIDAYGATTFAFSPDGHRLVAGANHYLSIWDVMPEPAGHLYLLDKSIHYEASSFSADNHTVAFGMSDGRLGLWDTAKLSEPPRYIQLADQLTRCVEFSPDGRWLAASSDASGPDVLYVAKLWDLAKGRPSLVNGFDLDKNSGSIEALAFSPDSNFLATGDVAGNIYVWDVQHLDKGPNRFSVEGPTASVMGLAGVESLAISSNKILAVGTLDGHIWLWDLKQEGSPPTSFDIFSKLSEDDKRTLPLYMFNMTTVAFSPDGKMLAASYGDGSVHIWVLSEGIVQGELTTTRVLALPLNSTSGIEAIRFSPDGTILGVMAERNIRLWDIEQPTSVDKATP
jgi:WD40 repeat protein